MPYKNIEARRAHHREYGAKWNKLNGHKRKLINQRNDAKRRLKKNADRNEKKFRFKLRDSIMRSPAMKDFIGGFGVSVVEEQWFRSPLFIVVDSNGKRRIETLNEPLPQW